MARYLLILFLFIIIQSCSKNEAAERDPSAFYLNSCISKTIAPEEITVCFNSVNDSRCPVKATCIWSGEAIAKFTLIKNNVSYPFTLSTLKSGHPYGSDTTVAGIKFHLQNILPYPEISTTISPSEIHAVLDIN